MKVKLGDVCDKGSSNLKQSDVINQNGQYPVYGAAGLLGNIDSYHQDKPYVAVVKDGAGIGRVTLQPGYSSVIGTLQYLLPKENVLPEYLYYVTKHMHLEKYYTGATIPHIYFKDYKNEKFNLDAIEKQQRIVDILKKIENIIESRQQELQKLDDLIRARFVELFGDLRTNTKEWKIQAFSELTDLITDGEHATPRRTTNGIYLLSARNILNHAIQLDDVDYIDQEEYDRIAKRVVPQAGDVLISCSGTVGRCCTVPVGLKFQMVRSAALLRFKPEINPKFAEYMITSEYLQEQINRLKTASSQANLFQGKIAKLKGFAPPMELQQEFNAFVAVIDKSKHHSPHLPNPPLKWYPLPKNEVPIMEEKIIAITNEMAEVLNIAQLKKLQEVLVKAFTTEEPERKPTNHEYLRLFLEAKSIEGCSPRTLQYYEVTVQHLFAAVNLPVRKMTTERMREYLSDYQQRRNCSKATIDNIRRNISSFFSWLEEEDHILKSPMRRIHKIKTKKTVKEVISDEDIEKLRDSCTTLRDLAMIDLLYSTGIRVGELVRLNIEDVNFESRECVVFGKGDKERRVYFDAKTKIHLKNYLESRRDTNRALFVSLLAPYNRLAISGVEIRLRKMGRMLNLKSIHPHKFRRTMATRAIDKGMPIEQVQKILGHSQIDTTMQYAIVNQNNVKMSHQKYIA